MTALGRGLISLALLGLSTAAFAQDAKPQDAKPAAAQAAAPAAAPAPGAAPAAAPGTPPATPPAAAAGAAQAPAGKADGGWSQEVAPANGTTGIALDEKQTELVKTVSGYFAKLNGLQGAFVQTGADNKKLKGKFFVKRPGKFRFDYALPSKQIIISDGEYLAIQDLDLNNEDRVALDQTPFRLLLRKDVDLLRDARIMEVQQAEDLIVLAIQDKSPDTPGRIKIFLATKPALELKEWVTSDAQGLDTRVQVSDVELTDKIDEKMFKIQQLGNRLSTPQ
ncbi:MAG: outer-membrane lipoprotein carrier protein LolA [Hyphomicrobium sp.]|nr:outer-membrane lipoprotein carrier protein LolA [Hyphomicrobium sp.]